MKRILLAILVALSMFSCGNKTAATAGIDSLSTDSDSICPEQGNADAFAVEEIKTTRKLGCWDYAATVEFPTEGPERLVESVRQFINDALNDYMGEKMKPYKGEASNGKAMLEYYAKEYLGSVNYDDYTDLPEGMRCEMSYDIKKVYEDEDIITFALTSYFFGGGAHGGTTSYGQTFRKSDGHRYGWDIIKKNCMAEVKKEIKKGLYISFEVSTDDELAECLMLDEDKYSVTNLPLPQCAPWIDEDGLHFIYQQYEIAAYAAGMPGACIPMSKAKNILNL